MSGRLKFLGAWSLVCAVAVASLVVADERRAPPPKFNESQLRGIFFKNLDEAFRNGRPSLSKLREAGQQAVAAKQSPSSGGGTASPSSQDAWSGLVSPASIEDEVKRVRLHFDSVVSTPAAFNGGGYLEARLDLSILATLFAVINEHGGEVRWKADAPAARDLIARTAYNCKAGSTQVYNEAKLRKVDLQDLVSGSGLTARDAPAENDWSSIADRSPLMEYLEQLINSLEDGVRDEGSFKTGTDSIKRNAELLAMVGEVLVQEGMDEADDGDYVGLSRAMTKSAVEVTQAVGRTDYDAARQSVSAIRQRCDACHEQYR